MVRYLIVSAMFLVCFSCSQDRGFRISGNIVPHEGKKKVFLTAPGEKEAAFVATVAPDGTFVLEGKVRKGRMLELHVERHTLPLFVENLQYSLCREGEIPYVISQKEGSLQNSLVRYCRTEREMDRAYARLCRTYEETAAPDGKRAVSESMRKAFASRKDTLLSGIRRFSGTGIAGYLLYRSLFICETDFDLFDAALAASGIDTSGNDCMQVEILRRYRILKGRQLTGRIPCFRLADIKGEMHGPDEFRGRFLLLDFWASWCAPCREKNRMLTGLYGKLCKLGVEVVSISMDEDVEAWKKAVTDDGLPWLQLSDPSGFSKSTVRKSYKVEQLPAVFLVDPEGNVLKANPSLDEIRDIVS